MTRAWVLVTKVCQTPEWKHTRIVHFYVHVPIVCRSETLYFDSKIALYDAVSSKCHDKSQKEPK